MRSPQWQFVALAALLVFGSLGPVQAPAAAVQAEHIEAELVAENQAVQPGRPFVVGLRLKMETRWHTYWRNPGDSGLATTLEWQLPPGFQAGPIQWPAPGRLPFSTLVNYGYEGEVLLLVELTPPPNLAAGTPVSLAARADWLVCEEEECIPGGADLTLSLPVKTGDLRTDGRWSNLFAVTRARLPREIATWKLSAVREDNGYRLLASPAGTVAASPAQAYFFAADTGVVEPSAPQTLTIRGAQRSVLLTQSKYASGPAERLRGIWVTGPPGSWGGGEILAVDIPVGGAMSSGGDRGKPGTGGAGTAAGAGAGAGGPAGAGWGLLGISLTAFLGGLILNLMPCVFPILSIKILGFVQQAGHDRARIARHGWAFAAGVLLSFWSLAGALLLLRAQGSQLAWGFQLQAPFFVMVLCVVLFALALSLLGVFEIGTSVTVAAGRIAPQEGLTGAFLSGALATFLATPCTAPFMGTALAYALTEPALPALWVFTALAAGMAAPYLLLSLRPAWLRFLPRPGAWMESLKQAMAFPLLGSVVWLLWVFGLQTGMDGVLQGLTSLLVLGTALWIWGRWGALHRTVIARLVAGTLAVGGSITAVGLAWSASGEAPPAGAPNAVVPSSVAWEPFTPERVAELRQQGRPVFVDFGAAWCATCIVNDRLVVDTTEIRAAFAAKKVVMLKADWTRRDPRITQALGALGKSGVPFHVLYAGQREAPLLARDLVSKEDLIAALRGLP